MRLALHRRNCGLVRVLLVVSSGSAVVAEVVAVMVAPFVVVASEFSFRIRGDAFVEFSSRRDKWLSLGEVT